MCTDETIDVLASLMSMFLFLSKFDVHIQDIFQYTIQFEGKSFSCPWDINRIYLSFYAFFHLLKYVFIIFLRVRHLTLHFFNKSHV